MDVFCLPTRGEGFGMPVVEAQGCGTPVIVTDNTSGKELAKTGFVIPIDDDDWVYTGLNTWRIQPKPSAITRALSIMRGRTQEWLQYKRDKVTAGVADYTWENVWERHWGPIIGKIEAMLPLERGNKDDISGEVSDAMEG
jgi:glycosyltransferase involved in cell wall biosynthesis